MFTRTTRAKCFRKKQRDFLTRQTRSISSKPTRRENEREKKRDEKKNTNRERSNRVRLPGPPLSISRHKYYKYYSLLSLTDKPAGAGDANLQLLLRPVRLGAVDPSQGVLLARGVRSFRISHSSCVLVSWCRRMCVFWGRRKRIKSRALNGLMEQFYDSLTVEKHLFFLYFERNFTERESGESFEFFHLFFCASFSTHCSLFFLSLFSLFSLKQLVCVFAREFSPHLKLFGGGSSSNHHRNLSSHYKSKHNNTQSAFYVVNAQKNKNRTHTKQKARENYCSTDFRRLFFILLNGDDEIFSRGAFSLACCGKR